ncbi:MAG TPA: 16S rRNA (adenine(1518)-N(6)/adenine(1519)-N(6))-dimethyltransferase RsmA [Thermoplasmata archaeon]|nr:16S rRNA (adenine(1518)-N(6)/adenine(1519)-N(6))-dimethyltransferase RsmA [Thermoplasmata archaeon]
MASRRWSHSVRHAGARTEPSGIPDRPGAVLATLRELGIVPSRRWGQSFLTDPFVADAEAALVGPCRTVVEVGGGLGILTAALVRRGVERLTVIERDPRLATFLRRTFGDRIRLVSGDALQVPVEPADCYVGNLPYSVATPLLLRWMEARLPRIVFLVQREVAERLASDPGSKTYGRLSIVAQLYGRVELFRTVEPEAFTPRPQVESRIAVFERRSDPIPVPSVPEFERIVRTLFASRRKQLGNLLPRVAPSPEATDDLACRAGWPESWRRLRPEDLPPPAYFALARAIHERGE